MSNFFDLNLPIGTRVQLKHDEERYPYFIAEAGTTGVVTLCDDTLLTVRADVPLENAEEWNNEIHFFEDFYMGGETLSTLLTIIK